MADPDATKDVGYRLLASPLTRWVAAIVVVLVGGYAAYDDVRDKAVGTSAGLADHSRELAALKERASSLEFRLADGSTAAQTRTDSRVGAVETFVQEQRAVNARIAEQNGATKEAVKEIQAEIKGLQSQMSTINGNISLILNSMQRREIREVDPR